MNYQTFSIKDLLLIEPVVFEDDRGFFMEKYKESDFVNLGLPTFRQDNYSFSSAGVIRGLHYQLPPMDQGKLVSVISGRVWDVAVDLRLNSETYKLWQGVELSGENKLSFYIPPGFAHGFSVLSESAHFFYKCTSEYSKFHERGIRFDDAELAIDWKIKNPVLSTKDLSLPFLKDIDSIK